LPLPPVVPAGFVAVVVVVGAGRVVVVDSGSVVVVDPSVPDPEEPVDPVAPEDPVVPVVPVNALHGTPRPLSVMEAGFGQSFSFGAVNLRAGCPRSAAVMNRCQMSAG
jgi:hypothetical protein